ncbi:DUF4280 domain-containing protein [Sphingomonas kyeonggiensis]|uniref:Putative Zn-binding protein involved in type VI secretion n=1 Tax=Sphingomonas kyeonggiensis TaxID=1268553 RepID=A0A7W6JWV1_9SPHN|nr:DUF4280 domain-containing protein [Sphingomonas kyeonggiensis]MBB4100066.1 putative Zn-binding protein involved in type VI secretion [Sphingomonas kyeonggiensis]
MPQLVSLGSVLSCSFGTVPMPMIVPPEVPVLADGLPAATIRDFVPFENIPAFGLCRSLANPEVAAATAAAQGVLTPMPCVPVTTSPWFPGAPEVLLDGVPALCMGSMCLCAWLGEIRIDEPGQESVIARG